MHDGGDGVTKTTTTATTTTTTTTTPSGGGGGEIVDVKQEDIAGPLLLKRTILDTPLFIARQILFTNAIAAACLYGSVMSAAFLIVNQREKANAHIAWCMALLGSPACGIRARVEGREHLMGRRPAVFVW
ncbi:hypothetical protein HDU67_008579 [Dinochytrium kinnereticum]|nr:hypothetical protein HDU67_008579 [Dinochytrium kinnereticum]